MALPNLLKNKRAQAWASENTGKIILLILSFVIVIIIISQVSFPSAVDSETCHLSVLAKKTMIEKEGLGGKWIDIPLQCKTEKMCITSGFGDKGCEFLEGTKGVSKISVSNKEELMKVLADSMASCWSMMGESKGPMVFAREATDTSKGIICEIIDFSDNIHKNSKDFNISADEFNEYLNTHGVPEKDISYWQFLTGSETPNIIQKGNSNININRPYSIIFIEYDASAGFLSGALAGFEKGVNFGGTFTTILSPLLNPIAISSSWGAIIGTASWIGDKFTPLNNPNHYVSSLLLRPYDAEQLEKMQINSFENIA